MIYARIFTSVRTNKKFLDAGPAPSWLWVCGVCYCQDTRTDGFIPDAAIDWLGVKNARRLVGHLERANLFEKVDGGWQIHDYLEHNKSAAQIDADKLKKQVAGEAGGKASGEARRKQSASDTAKHTSKHHANPDPATATDPASDPATDPPVLARSRPGTLIQRRNLNAAFEGARGLYVLESQHQKFLGLLNGRLNETELFAWYQRTADAWATGVHRDRQTGADMPKFWDARFNEEWPADRPTVASKAPAWAQKAQARP